MAKSSVFKYAADDSAGFLLWKITALWQQRLAKVLGGFGITQTQYAIMASLKWFEENNAPLTQGHLAEHTKIEKMTVSKSIRKLEQIGFVLRKPSATDSRAISVQFSARGKREIVKIIIAIENADEEFFSGLTNAQLALYKSLTITLIASNNQT